MSRYVAFLRGMNIGGRRVKNDELREAFEEMGFVGVSTFRASGNVILDEDGERGSGEVSRLIEKGLGGSLGFEVKVFLRSAAEVEAIAEYEPFEPKAVEASAGKLQVALLSDQPRQSARKEVLGMATDEDRLAIRDCELYWLPSAGTLDSELNLREIESALGTWTMRTKGTIEQVAAKHCAS
jgi:uncharacterized protein (DUF1697 family)